MKFKVVANRLRAPRRRQRYDIKRAWLLTGEGHLIGADLGKIVTISRGDSITITFELVPELWDELEEIDMVRR